MTPQENVRKFTSRPQVSFYSLPFSTFEANGRRQSRLPTSYGKVRKHVGRGVYASIKTQKKKMRRGGGEELVPSRIYFEFIHVPPSLLLLFISDVSFVPFSPATEIYASAGVGQYLHEDNAEFFFRSF